MIANKLEDQCALTAKHDVLLSLRHQHQLLVAQCRKRRCSQLACRLTQSSLGDRLQCGHHRPILQQRLSSRLEHGQLSQTLGVRSLTPFLERFLHTSPWVLWVLNRMMGIIAMCMHIRVSSVRQDVMYS